ncbi:helix-turn-helix transcriptional regulator [Paenarthrobacter sp. DKR-5]|uniref:helix-turn-helix domain-containing protein n=1 Tax=Paenarthrobacter sp. DKR-5 TaxID=2835535 RepID=UPI001BDBF8BB|nr:helix-turn-helix transcriptional regulator [Paenarthrobacter sp. DKR-5]MBT1002637.1 helix-turn-helix transcriptional regulator [Paenarthrobacter sp. DKR-5]
MNNEATGRSAGPGGRAGVTRRDRRGEVGDVERERLAAGFGAELSRLRAAAGLTIDRASELAGLNRQSLSRLEHGRTRPTVDSINALAAVLDPVTTTVSVDRLRALAGPSLRTHHRRRSPARKALTVSQAEWALRSLLRTQEDNRRAAKGLPAALVEREAAILAPLIEQAREDLARAEALAEVEVTVRRNRGESGESVG